MKTLGIVNITRDSFSDGGRYLNPSAAIAHAIALRTAGADVVDLGPASSHPDADVVSADEEIARLTPVMAACADNDIPVSVDSDKTATQRFALAAGATMLNDIHGFADETFYDELASASASLIVMHAVQAQGAATRIATEKHAVYDGLCRFFEDRLGALVRAGVDEDRLIVDPGMGFFLGSDPAVSLHVLARVPDLGARFGRPVLVSVSRKSFLQKTARTDAQGAGAATLAAELFAARAGAAWIRTHDIAALRAGLEVDTALHHAGNGTGARAR